MLLGYESEGVAVHTIPVRVGGEAKGAAAGIARTAATEKTAGIERHLIARDRDVLKGALLQDVVMSKGLVPAIHVGRATGYRRSLGDWQGRPRLESA